MATLSELCSQAVLLRHDPKPRRSDYEERFVYFTPVFLAWAQQVLRTAAPVDSNHVSPAKQFIALLYDFCVGKPMSNGKHFKRMLPGEHDIYELRTPDVRLYGWFPKKNHFIVVCGDLMFNTHNQTGLASQHRGTVKTFRATLDLDEPKWPLGADPNDLVLV